MLTESNLDSILRNYLCRKGWKMTNTKRKTGQQGWDIKAWNKKYRKRLLVECKGDSKSEYNTQKIHNSFWISIGQVMSRMDIKGNDQRRARIYAIGIPKKWGNIFRKKARKMEYGWNFLKLKIFLIGNSEDVEEITYKQFLK